MNTIEFTVERAGLEMGADIDIITTYIYLPGTPDVYTLSNGDPGYQGDPEEIDIISVIGIDTGNEYTLSKKEEEKLFQLIRKQEDNKRY